MSDAQARIAALPIWSSRPRLAPLPGGLSNLSFRATDSSGSYVVRITRDLPFHHVFRDRELMSARAAHAAGFAPELVFAEPGLTVTRFIDGEVLTAAGLQSRLPEIVRLLQRFHADMPAAVSGPAALFWVFHVNRDYLRRLAAEGGADAADLRRWGELNTRLEQAQAPLTIVFGHHDLLPANFIDDGRRLWLIDYEYAGFGTAMFDLANLSSNSAFPAAASDELLERYFGPARARALRASHACMECASLLREALWSLISVNHLDAPGADYAGYARQNLERLDAALAACREHVGA